MLLKQVSQSTYFEQCNEISTKLMDILLLSKTQLGIIKSLKDIDVRKQLVSNEKEMYKLIKEISIHFVKHSKTTIKKELSPNMKSGFSKLLNISQEMSEFANWDINELKSRNDITRYVCDYIKTNNLACNEDKRKINPDEKLTKLLGVSETITYNYIQGVLKSRCFKV